MRELILLCFKGVHFKFSGVTISTNISCMLIVEVERNLITILNDNLSCGRRYADDTVCLIKNGSDEHVLPTLNNFYSFIKFSYETESGNKLSFLDVQLIRTGDNIETCIFRKPTNTDVYIHWDSFAQFQWKYSTLKIWFTVYILFAQHLNQNLNLMT